MSTQPYSDGNGNSYAEIQEKRDGKGGWIETYTGVHVFPMDPEPDVIEVRDIAHALALNCRYNGHCSNFYSVAEHSVLLSIVAEDMFEDMDIARWALIHDASETYLPDMPRPIKSLVNGFDKAEERFHRVLAERFDLPYPMPESVHYLDNAILADEAFQLMYSGGKDWVLPEEGLGIELALWTPETAEFKFLQRFNALPFDEEISFTFAGEGAL